MKSASRAIGRQNITEQELVQTQANSFNAHLLGKKVTFYSDMYSEAHQASYSTGTENYLSWEARQQREAKNVVPSIKV
jgi:hypothetical protein